MAEKNLTKQAVSIRGKMIRRTVSDVNPTNFKGTVGGHVKLKRDDRFTIRVWKSECDEYWTEVNRLA